MPADRYPVPVVGRLDEVMPQATSRSSPALRQRSASPTGRKVGAAAHHATGGIHVQRAELQQAFDFFDVTKKGYLTMDDLKARLPIFYSNVPVRELKFLMNNKSELTFNDLYELLADNTLTNFDPAAEAFKVRLDVMGAMSRTVWTSAALSRCTTRNPLGSSAPTSCATSSASWGWATSPTTTSRSSWRPPTWTVTGRSAWKVGVDAQPVIVLRC